MTEFPVVLVINCGSSSIKFSVLDAASCDCLLNGVAEGINAERAFLSLNGGEPVALAQRGYKTPGRLTEPKNQVIIGIVAFDILKWQ